MQGDYLKWNVRSKSQVSPVYVKQGCKMGEQNKQDSELIEIVKELRWVEEGESRRNGAVS